MNVPLLQQGKKMTPEPIRQLQMGIQAACDKKGMSIIDACLVSGTAPSTIYRFMNTGNIRLVTLVDFINNGLGCKLETVLRKGRR